MLGDEYQDGNITGFKNEFCVYLMVEQLCQVLCMGWVCRVGCVHGNTQSVDKPQFLVVVELTPHLADHSCHHLPSYRCQPSYIHPAPSALKPSHWCAVCLAKRIPREHFQSVMGQHTHGQIVTLCTLYRHKSPQSATRCSSDKLPIIVLAVRIHDQSTLPTFLLKNFKNEKQLV